MCHSTLPHYNIPFSCTGADCVAIIYNYVIVKSRYKHDIQVIAQDLGEVEVAGDDLDIMRVNWDITNFYLMQIDFQSVDLINNN